MKKLLPLFVGLALVSGTNAFAVLVFWDMNGTDGGSGGPAPTGTWSADAINWNTNGAGGGATGPEKWGSGDYAVFAAGDDATGAYTVSVSNVVKVADIHVDLGTVTLAPDPVAGGMLNLSTWDDVTTDRRLSAGHKDPNATAIYNVVLTNANGIIRYKRGTVVFGATNKFTGPVKIEGGILKLGVPYAIPTSCPLVLANNDPAWGDFNEDWRYTPAEFHTAGLSQQLGTLKLTGTDTSIPRVLDLGGGPGTLAFADSSSENWGAFTLTINNYALGTSKLRFGTNAGGLTKPQLARLQFADYSNLPGRIDANGFVTPAVPVIQSIRRNGP